MLSGLEIFKTCILKMLQNFLNNFPVVHSCWQNDIYFFVEATGNATNMNDQSKEQTKTSRHTMTKLSVKCFI